MLRSLLGAASAVAVVGLVLAAVPAKATTFNETITTPNAISGYVIDLIGLTTDPTTNIAESLVSGIVTGTGLYAGLGGTLSLILPTPANQATYGSEFTWDGVAYPLAPYFSASGSSGILLYDSAGYLLNPYFDPTNDTYYVSVWLASGASGSESNPSNLVGIMTADITQTIGGASATPLPAAWAMMLGGLVFLGWMARRRKTSNKDAHGWDLATA